MPRSDVSSSVGSVSVSCSHGCLGETSVKREALASSERWLTQFLKEMQSVLPYKRPRLSRSSSQESRRRQSSDCDWEIVLCQLSRPIGRWMKRRGDDASIRSCRALSRSCRLAFSRDFRRLTVPRGSSEQVAASLLAVFKGVTSLKVSHHIGRLHGKLRNCTSLTELSIEPVHFGVRHGHQLSILGSLSELQNLHLWGTVGCTSEGLAHLASLTNLRLLSLGSKLLIQGSDLQLLTCLQKLRKLEMMGCMALNDCGLSAIAQLTRLSALYMGVARDGDCRVSEKGIRSIAQLTLLQDLALTRFAPVEGPGLRHVSQLTRMTCLTFDAIPGISSFEDWNLRCLQNLQSLSVKHVRSLGDGAFLAILQLSSIRVLHLGDCADATDTAAEALSTLPLLASLKLDRYPWLTEHGLELLLENPTLRTLKITGIYSITGDALHDVIKNNGLSFDMSAWRQQILLVTKNP